MLRENSTTGELFEGGRAIEGVGDQVLARGEDVLRPDNLLEGGNYFGSERHVKIIS